MVALRTAIVAAAGVAAVLVLVLAHGGSTPSIDTAQPLAVRATLTPAAASFGDPLTARIVVALDRRAGALKVTNTLAPLTALSAARTRRTVSGSLETVTITQRVACVTAPCVARAIDLPAVRVSAGGQQAIARWPRLRLRSRVTPGDVARSNPRFALDRAPASPSYRIEPATLSVLLEILAALAAAAAAALVVLEASRRRRPAVQTDELDRALRLVREAEARPAPDRRRALFLLSRVLDGGLRRSANELAWSRPSPEPPVVEDLVSEVERQRAG